MSAIHGQLTSGLPLGAGDSLHGLAGTGSAITYTIFGVEVGAQTQFVHKVLAQGVLGTADGLMYAVAAGKTAAIMSIVLANTTASGVSGVALSINGSSATAGNQIVSSITIPANGQAIFTGEGVLSVYDSSGQRFQTGTATFDSTIPAGTTPLALGTVGTAVTAPHRDHTHQSPGGIASIVAATAGITTTQTQVVGATIPAALLQAGTVLRFRVFGFITSTVDNIVTLRVRLGPTTLTGNIPASLAAHCGNSGTVTAAGFVAELLLTVRTAGGSGTCYASGFVISAATGAAVTQAFANSTDIFVPASVAVDTTVANVAEFTVLTAAATTTVTCQTCSVEIVKM